MGNIGIAVAIELNDVGISRPSGVVESSVSEFELVVRSLPSGDFTVSEKCPCLNTVVSLFESTVDDNILVSAEAHSVELDIINALSETVRNSSSDEVNAVLSDS